MGPRPFSRSDDNFSVKYFLSICVCLLVCHLLNIFILALIWNSCNLFNSWFRCQELLKTTHPFFRCGGLVVHKFYYDRMSDSKDCLPNQFERRMWNKRNASHSNRVRVWPNLEHGTQISNPTHVNINTMTGKFHLIHS